MAEWSLWLCRSNDAKDLDMAASDTAGKELKMRMNKKSHAGAAKRPMQKKKGKSAKNNFRQNPFANLKEDSERSFSRENRIEHMNRVETEHMAEMIECVLEEIFGCNRENGMPTKVGVIELTPADMLSMEIRDLKNQTEKYRREIAEKKSEYADRIKGHKKQESAIPPFEGCGEEVFQEMLMDLNYMAKMILEADHMMKMVDEEGVNPEDARCVTYLSVRNARDIMKKWDKYRRCEI